VAPKLRATDLAALVGRIAEQWQQESGRTLEVAVEPVVARVDPDKVERIVENLLANVDRHTMRIRRSGSGSSGPPTATAC
jgi:signal transduction histidine kinase